MGERSIVKIDETKCNGCGLCIPNCHEGAIQIIDGKARIIDDKYCDGMGNCLGHCPEEAITIINRDAVEFDEGAVKERLEGERKDIIRTKGVTLSGCPGTLAKNLKKVIKPFEDIQKLKSVSYLNQWPVQLKLVNPEAEYFENADILIAADCTAYAYGAFHKDFIEGRVTLIGCPKLDDIDYYTEKLTKIFNNDIKSITVVRMSVPCCAGIVAATQKAIFSSGKIVNYKEVIIGLDGEII
ncbi:MAG TPA: 4Fe-4S dicluster domain-containing protein [Clostridiaceae bacterium]